MYLHIKIREARDLHKTGILGKNDVYVKVMLGEGNEGKTTVKKNAGKVAVFNETIQLQYRDHEDLKFEVYDHDSHGKDDLIGFAAITPSSLQHTNWQGELILMRKGKPAGVLALETHF